MHAMDIAMLKRYSIAVVSGIVVTFALLWVMQILIATGRAAVTEKRDFRFVDFVRIKRDETLLLDQNKPEKPPEPEQPPDMPEPQLDQVDTTDAVKISYSPNVYQLDLTRGNFAIVDGDYLPIVKVAPIYPRRAQTRGLEGYCLLEFTVTQTGAVKDARAVECTSSLFQRASVNAALKFKYKPRVVDGQPIEVPGVQHIIRFEIDDD